MLAPVWAMAPVWVLAWVLAQASVLDLEQVLASILMGYRQVAQTGFRHRR